MLLKRQILDGIAEGRITLVFRRWKRPTVKPGGSLRTVIGVLAIDAVDVISAKKITKQDAHRAGYSSKAELLAELNARPIGDVYRITVRFSGADPRHALRESGKLSRRELEEVKEKLAGIDSRCRLGPWTMKTLEVIAAHPGMRAAELAAPLEMELKRFKSNVRKLKELGLTESLKVGYRLSPRGRSVMKGLRS